MAERYYINEIFENNLEQTMEHDLEKDYPAIKAFIKVNSIRNQILIRLFDRNSNYVASFAAKEFECERYNETELHNKKSEAIIVTNIEIKRWYVRWMKNHFDTYKNDYIANINKVANEDLGI